MSTTLYSILRAILFAFPAETSHVLALKSLNISYRLGLSRFIRAPLTGLAPVKLMGLLFENPVGLAAGLDKNGDYIDALGSLGFGFIEVGTITPKPQGGNPKPRLFRLNREQAIINRMGFNNKGVAHLVEKLKRRRYSGVVGVNIGKNLTTPVDNALEDYLFCLKAVYQYSDYIVVNLSSPNTPGLRELQFGEHLDSLLAALKQQQLVLKEEYSKYVPLLVKIAPDVLAFEVEEIAQAIIKHDIDGVSATNTTISREGVEGSMYKEEAGGLSGIPVCEKSTQVVALLNQKLEGKPIIGIGGIHDFESACERRDAGADLLQIYTGFIYQGPALIAEAVKGFFQGEKGSVKPRH